MIVNVKGNIGVSKRKNRLFFIDSLSSQLKIIL